MLKVSGFLASCVALGGWFAAWTPAVAGEGTEICPAAQQIIIDAPQTMADLTGDPEMPQYIDGVTLVSVLTTDDIAIVRVGEADWFLGFTDPTGEFIWPIMNLSAMLDWSPGLNEFEVPGGPALFGHPLSLLEAEIVSDGHGGQIFLPAGGGELCLGIQCENPDGTIGGWTPCDDPLVLDAIQAYKACVREALKQILGSEEVLLTLDLMLCISGAVAWWLLALCAGLFLGLLWDEQKDIQEKLSVCWETYATTFRNAMRTHCHGSQIPWEEIPIPDLHPSPCGDLDTHPEVPSWPFWVPDWPDQLLTPGMP